MRKIVYYVATSLDGFIAGLNDDVSGFVYTGSGVATFLSDLKSFDTVIMGKNTYEFGYKYGVKPGEPSPTYAHMKHYIFSDNLDLKNPDPLVQVKKMDINEIDTLRNEEGTDIYLCGGGRFAGWLLDHQRIDVLKLKMNPLVLGDGIKLFGPSTSNYKVELVESTNHENGLRIMTFNVIY